MAMVPTDRRKTPLDSRWNPAPRNALLAVARAYAQTDFQRFSMAEGTEREPAFQLERNHPMNHLENDADLRRPAWICVGVVLWVLGTPTVAQTAATSEQDVHGTPTFEIDRATVSAGVVAPSRSACFDLSGRIGQPLAGASLGGAFVLEAGPRVEDAFSDSLFRSSFEECLP
jgi:hypothetical protein